MEPLTESDLEAWAQVSGIGMANALTGLSKMLGQEIAPGKISARRVPLADATDLLGGPEAPTAAVYIALSGDANGHMVLVYQREFAFELVDMAILARELNMTNLIEAHDVERLLKIRHYVGFPHAGYSLLGINNRDLKTMKTDISHTFRMLEFIEDRKVVVCESGISSAADLARLRQRGVNIVLVGEHLLRQPNPGDALRQLLGQGTNPDI